MAESGILVLSILSSVTGLLMIVGGIWLIYKEKIYIDRETKEVTEVELPFGLKFKTNIPALVLFLIGFVLLFYPIYGARQAQEKGVEKIQIAGEVDGDSFPVDVHAVVTSDNLQQPGQFALLVPRLGEGNQIYKVIYLAGGTVLADIADLESARNGKIGLPAKRILANDLVHYHPPASLPQVPDEFKQ
jgi:hypothetical protein